MSDEFALLLNISQNKWTLEEGDGGSGTTGVTLQPALREKPHLGEIAPCFPLEPELQSQLGDRSPRDT